MLIVCACQGEHWNTLPCEQPALRGENAEQMLIDRLRLSRKRWTLWCERRSVEFAMLTCKCKIYIVEQHHSWFRLSIYSLARLVWMQRICVTRSCEHMELDAVRAWN